MLYHRTPHRKALLYITPALLAMLIVHIVPILLGIYICFIDLDRYNVTTLLQAPFVGLDNFFTVFQNNLSREHFFSSIITVLYFCLIVIPLQFIIAFGVALLLNRKFSGKTLVKGILLLPYITPDSVMYSLWRFMFQARVGLINMLLIKLGIIDQPLVWLIGEKALITVMIASIWKGWPYLSLVLLAGLHQVPETLHEAATLDGANRLQKLIHITLPVLWPICKTFFILLFIWNFYSFNQFYILFGGNVPTRAIVPSIFIFRTAFTNFHYSEAAVMSFMLFIIILILSYFFIIKRKDALHDE